MLADQGLKNRAFEPFQTRMGPRLIFVHMAALAEHMGCKSCSKAPFHAQSPCVGSLAQCQIEIYVRTRGA